MIANDFVVNKNHLLLKIAINFIFSNFFLFVSLAKAEEENIDNNKMHFERKYFVSSI